MILSDRSCSPFWATLIAAKLDQSLALLLTVHEPRAALTISKILMRGLCAAAGVLALAGAAHADTSWNITRTFNDGGALTGVVTLDQ